MPSFDLPTARSPVNRDFRLRFCVTQVLTRHGIEETFKPQPFSLIVTIADPERKAPVYDEMGQIVRSRFTAQNLTVRAAARIRSRT